MRLEQSAIVVPLHQKLDMLWSFIKLHLNSNILVFLTSRKQARYVYEAFKHLRPGIPLKLLHGKMNQEKRLKIYSQFPVGRSVLFATDVCQRVLNFDNAVDWVVQVDCPSDVASYIKRVGWTGRHNVPGKSLLFVEPSEMKILEKLKSSKLPIKTIKANKNCIQPVSPALGSLLAKKKDMPQLAQRAFITYLKAVDVEKDKEVFDVTKLDIDAYAASLGLPLTPNVRFLKRKVFDEESDEDDLSGSEEEAGKSRPNKKAKVYLFGSDDEETKNKEGDLNVSSMSMVEKEDLALKLLQSLRR